MRDSDMAQANDSLAVQNQILKDTLEKAISILEEVRASGGFSWRELEIRTILDKCVVIGLLPDDYLEYD